MRRGIRSVKLKHLNPSGRFASGNTRFYFRPKGKKGIRMPDLPMDHPNFLAAYAKAAGVTPRAPVRDGSLGAAMQLYKASDSFALLAPGTRAARRPMLDEAMQKYGQGDRNHLAARHIEKDLTRFTGHARNNHLKMWRSLCAWMLDHYHMSINPSDGIKRVKTAKTDGHIPWTAEEVKTFRAFWPISTMERLTFELIFWTGARVSDAIRLGRGNIDRDGWLNFRQQKTGGEVSIPFARDLPEFAECYADDLEILKQAVDAQDELHMTFLHTQRGAARSPKSVSQWFATKVRKAGIEERTAHGLRKARAVALAEAGGTSPQIGAWTGHESLQEIERYIRKFNKRKALSRTETEQKVPTSSVKFQKG